MSQKDNAEMNNFSLAKKVKLIKVVKNSFSAN